MTSCDAARVALVELVFTELDDEACARLNEHLETCDACRQAERELLAMRERVRGSAGVPDVALGARVRAALAAAAPAPSPLWRRPVPAWAALAAAAACAVAAALVVRPPADVPPRPDVVAEAPGVPVPPGEVTFRFAEPFETGVSGTGESPARRGASRPALGHGRDTL